MPDDRKLTKIAPAAGITRALHEKSRTRREEQHALVAIESRARPPRKDLLSALAVTRVAIDSIRL